MEAFLIALYVLAGIVVLYLIIYIVYKLSSDSAVLKSKFQGNNRAIAGDQYYYLPTAGMTIKAVATVLVTKSTQNWIKNAKLLQLELNAETALEPDLTCLFSIDYQQDNFSNDELRITTTANKLLQNISSTVEDRITTIIAQVAQAPAQMAAVQQNTRSIVARQPLDQIPQEEITQAVEFTKTFYIPPEEMNSDQFSRTWKITIDGLHDKNFKQPDASFTIKNPRPKQARIPDSEPYEGLFTRLLAKLSFEVFLAGMAGNEEPAARFSVVAPDIESQVKLPVKRAFFVKKVQVPAFSNGLLVENYIVKPSEMEGVLSIPINILKAVASIPAQLFHFRITRLQQEASLEKAVQELAALRAAGQKQSTQKDDTGIRQQLEKLQNDVQQAKLQQQLPAPRVAEEPEPIPKLGKLPAREGVETFRFGNRAHKGLLRNALGVEDLPLPVACNWAGNYQGNWKTYMNYDIRSCVPAAAAHLITAWTASANPPAVIPSDEDVLEAYKTVSGYDGNKNTDKGCDTRKFIKHWGETGLGTDKISFSIGLTPRVSEKLKQAVYWFGGCMVGLKLPLSAKKQLEQPLPTKNQVIWNVPAGGPIGEGLPGSWDCHAVAVLGYNDTQFIAISWEKEILMEYAFYENYNDETYVILSERNWINAGISPTHETTASLIKRLEDMS